MWAALKYNILYTLLCRKNLLRKIMEKSARKMPVPKRLARPDTLRDRIYDELRKRLQQAPLAAQERLVDIDIAAAYGTSRMPARDALLRLVNEGYLVGTTRGFVAPTLTAEDVRDIFEVRRLLEPAAIAGVAAELDAAAEQQLDAALDRARRAAANDDGVEMMLANMAFREAWLGRVKNQRLAGTIARFVDHVQTVRQHTLVSAQTRAVVLAGLTGLHEALLQRDGARARTRMEQFMADAESAYFSAQEAQRSVAGSQQPAAAAARLEPLGAH
jgi:DNA-binding GntR family transcriptional regulator